MDEMWVLADKKADRILTDSKNTIQVYPSSELAVLAIHKYEIVNCTPRLLFTSKDYDDLQSEVNQLKSEVQDVRNQLDCAFKRIDILSGRGY